jgi:hypothetical protein
MKQELDSYRQRPNASAFYLDIKQKQIRRLEDVCEANESVLESFLIIAERHDQQRAEWEEHQFKLEACNFYHGVSLHELMFFVHRPVTSVAEDIQRAFTENWVQTPLKLMPFRDEQKVQDDDLQVTISKEGEFTYSFKTPPGPIRYSDKPTVPFELLKQSAEEHRQRDLYGQKAN